MSNAFFVTGTDTEVGKTFSSCALLSKAQQQGMTTLGLKPMAAGCESIRLESGKEQFQNEDAIALMNYSTVKLSYSQVNPCALKVPASPHISAALEGKLVSASRIQGYVSGALMTRADFSLVEGAGGWRVPISNRETMADLARLLDLPVILVVGLRLGCLNHAMLTAEAIIRDGLKLAGWVSNSISPEPMSYESENLATLRSAIRAPYIGHVPFSSDGDPKTVCNDINLDVLDL